MIAPRWRKALRDVVARPGRSILAILAMAAGVFESSAMLYKYAVLQPELTQMYGRTRPSSATISLDRASDALVDSVRLLADADVVVSHDTGPLHLARLVRTPSVALFGPTVTEFGFGPLRAGDVTLGVDELQCRPCSPHGPPQCPLGHHRCMRELTVAAVIAAIEEIGALRRRS